MPRRAPIIMAKSAGVRLYQVVPKAGLIQRYMMTTLREDGHKLYATLAEAKKAFRREVQASRSDPRVGPYVS